MVIPGILHKDFELAEDMVRVISAFYNDGFPAWQVCPELVKAVGNHFKRLLLIRPRSSMDASPSSSRCTTPRFMRSHCWSRNQAMTCL